MPIHKNQIITLTIDTIASDGCGVGRAEGKAVFVPGSAVGDVLRVKIVKDAKRFAYARIEQLVAPGPGRVEEDCPISRTCGGCCFRHLTYEAELQAKQGFVEDALQRIGKLHVDVRPILPSPAVNRYRNKAQYPVARGQHGGYQYGFYAQRSHRIVPCTDCLLHTAGINQLAQRTAQLLEQAGVAPYEEANHTGQVRHIFIRQGGNSEEMLLCIVARQKPLHNLSEMVQTLLEEFPVLASIVWNINPLKTNVILGEETLVIHGEGALQDTLCGVPLHLGPHSFSQVNTKGAEQLFAVAKEYAALRAGDTLLDLYCGTGVIGLSMAEACHALVGVEVIPQAVASAQRAAAKMGLAHRARFIAADAGQAATQLAAEGTRPTVVVVDPPRKGCDEATIKAMLGMAPQRIVMVSCNPATMARDVALLAVGGYVPTAVQPVDMFPRTQHVECVVLLVRQNG